MTKFLTLFLLTCALLPASQADSTCESAVVHKPWRWGNTSAKKPYSAKGPLRIRVDQGLLQVAPRSVFFDQYSLFILDSDGRRFVDLSNSKFYPTETVMKAAVDSGELLQFFVPGKKAPYRHVLNRRSSKFSSEKSFEGALGHRSVMISQIGYVLRTRVRKKAFRKYWQRETQALGLKLRPKKEDILKNLWAYIDLAAAF